jgi:hypothetical protein
MLVAMQLSAHAISRPHLELNETSKEEVTTQRTNDVGTTHASGSFL